MIDLGFLYIRLFIILALFANPRAIAGLFDYMSYGVVGETTYYPKCSPDLKEGALADCLGRPCEQQLDGAFGDPHVGNCKAGEKLPEG